MAYPALALLAAASFGTGLPERFGGSWPPGPMYDVLAFAGLDQSWRMFAPEPSNHDWRLSAPGRLADGSAVEVLPSTWGGLYSRWMKIVDRLTNDKNDKYLQEFGRGLCRVHNNHLATGQPALETFQIYLEEAWVEAPAGQRPDLQQRLLWDHHCF